MSLAEALVTSFAMLLALSLVASLASEYHRAMSFSAEKDKVMVAARTVLESLRGDLEAAFSVDLTTPDHPILQRVNQDVLPELRIGAPMAVPWTPHATAWLQDVDYRLEDERVLRRSGEEYVVATGLRGLKVEPVEPGLISVELSFMEANQRVRTVRSLVLRRVGMEP